jgi:tetratricopeptide (TPR) repeat protein
MAKLAQFEFLISGRLDGRRETEIVEATTGDAAVRQFEEDGFTDIVLHTDEMTAPLSKPSVLLKNFSAERQVWLRTAGEGEFAAFVTLFAFRRLWLIPLLGLLIACLAWFADGSLVVVFAGLAFIMVPAILPIMALWKRAFGVNRRLLEAIGWARWEQVLGLLARPEFKKHSFDNHLSRAQALAGLGELTAALREYDCIADLPEIPRALYWMQQSIVYHAAGEREKMMPVLEWALEAAPTSSAVMIIYAHNLIVVRRDLALARTFLAEARKHAISDIIAPYLHSADGVLAQEEDRPEDAVAHLSKGFALLSRFVRCNPSLLAQSSRMQGRLALALAAAGDTAAARRHFLQARPLLLAHREDEFVQKCEQAIG